MRASVLALIVGAGLAVPLRADLRIKVKETFASGIATRAEYYKGNRWRRESEQSGGYWIVDSTNKRTITVDPAKREYSINTFTRTEQTTDPYQTIVIEVETRDTGEQRQMFGHPVHHFITTERRRTEYPDKPPSETREIITDGWYLDFTLPFPNHIGAIAVFTAFTIDQHGRHTVPKIKVTRDGPVPHGLPVWVQTGDNLSEVTEFSEAPLDQRLFEPPEGFRRVVHPFPGEQLPWNDQLLFRWQQLQGWLDSLFQVAP
jgi:hypothetical protein